jgi:hypothetical protein
MYFKAFDKLVLILLSLRKHFVNFDFNKIQPRIAIFIYGKVNFVI